MARRYWLFGLLLAGVAVALAGLGTLAGPVGAQFPSGAPGAARVGAPWQGTPTATPTGCTGWSVVPGASVVTTPNALLGVAAVATNDVWAVGLALTQTLTEHWTGTQWTVVPSPNTGAYSTTLQSVAAVAANDVWAVGVACADSSCLTPQSVIEHWNGAQWSVVPGPTGTNALFGVTALAANDVWAVGSRLNGFFIQTFIVHWNGTAWSMVASPNVGFFPNILFGVSAVAANDIWAVGVACGDATCGTGQTLTLHWNGTTWSTVASPNAGANRNALAGVAAGATDNVWAVGQTCVDAGCTMLQGLVLHWTGSAWMPSPVPVLGTIDTHYNAVTTALANNDAWAVGSYSNDGATFANAVLHWNGSQWTAVPVPNPGATRNGLNALARITATDIWAVGGQDAGSGTRTQIQHYSGPCATATATPVGPSPTATRTPTPVGPSPTATSPGGASPTATPAGGSPTATATATQCPIQFSDVPSSNPFYPFIRCLACRSIVSGYSDGTYRWGADVTRGQLSKIIANAAGLTNAIPSTQQTFEDVPGSNAFWLFVERLAGTGAISGYACGGAGEPCNPPGNRPYFRWTANATRSQIAKITAIAAHITDTIPTTQQTFEDVPGSNPFWLWVEQLAGRGVISGYTCGGAGEPCVPPGNRPYFRWTANATRGQMAKIAAQTFYPNCQTPAR